MVVNLDVNAIIKDVNKLDAQLGKIPGLTLRFVQLAVVQFAELLLGRAQARAPVTTGALRASGTVSAPLVDPDGSVIVFMGFNIIYARIQDEGGVIRPVTAQALFIPLRQDPFIVPNAPGLKVGVDFVFAQEAILVGNTYWTDTIEEGAPTATQDIGRATFNLLKEAFPPEPGSSGLGFIS